MTAFADLVAAATDPKGPPKELLEKLRGTETAALEDLVNKIQVERTALREAQVMIQKIIGTRTVIDNAKRKLQTASPEERAAMLQLLQPEGIKSEEKVPPPGHKRG